MDPTQTGTAGQGDTPSVDAIARGLQIYDEIMASIEPELTSAVLPTLAEKYANETPEESKARGERYDAAFIEYDKRYATYMADMGGKVRSLQRTVRAGIESDEHVQEEQQSLTNLEASISTL
jgi:hypothetical protein